VGGEAASVFIADAHPVRDWAAVVWRSKRGCASAAISGAFEALVTPFATCCVGDACAARIYGCRARSNVLRAAAVAIPRAAIAVLDTEYVLRAWLAVGSGRTGAACSPASGADNSRCKYHGKYRCKCVAHAHRLARLRAKVT
jgi:hypothetical protein